MKLLPQIMKAKHISRYLEETSEEFDSQLDDLLVQLSLTDCINLSMWLMERVNELIDELVNHD